jgi:ribose-phosphate pyrophosphokinase
VGVKARCRGYESKAAAAYGGDRKRGEDFYLMETEMIFHTGNHFPKLGLVATEGAKELGDKINRYLVAWAANGPEAKDTFLIGNECPRFSSGDGKGIIKETIRGMDLYFLVDVGNYSCKYNIFGQVNAMSPDDHFQDLKRLIQAASGKAHSMSVIMPLLYGCRQHRRSYRESLDCACALQELQAMGVDNIVTFDTHDARVQNAIPLMGFDNIIAALSGFKDAFASFSGHCA